MIGIASSDDRHQGLKTCNGESSESRHEKGKGKRVHHVLF